MMRTLLFFSSFALLFSATVTGQRDNWYMDDIHGTKLCDDGLNKVLCEEDKEQPSSSSDEQPDILDECCACDEAKYEVIFEGIWSKYTHPKDFPANFWLTHFSDIIGASHSADFRMWEYGGYASEGLQQVAELGVTKKLEAELKAESNKIRTIIKARGLWYPNLNGKTFAVFRADRKHHLMSLVSMLGPSPDWIVGVSALELCLKNCSWSAEKVINLYLWDAGTDSGVSYLSPNQPTEPHERIRKITTGSQSNTDSPFYGTTASRMKPFAKLTVTRQRMYEKPCDEENDIGLNRNPAEAVDNDDPRGECQVTEWTEWSACSASCGQGVRIRTRNYVSVAKARVSNCVVNLIEKDNCNVDCVGNVSCATTPWTDWSDCSVTCGKGYRTRTRLFTNQDARKLCSHVDLVDVSPCFGIKSECLSSEIDGGGRGGSFNPSFPSSLSLPTSSSPSSSLFRGDEMLPPVDCEHTPWGPWTECSKPCGKAHKTRRRMIKQYPMNGGKPCPGKLVQRRRCKDNPPCPDDEEKNNDENEIVKNN